MASKRIAQIVTTYQDPEVRNIETYWRELEKIESLHQAGHIDTNEYFHRWNQIMSEPGSVEYK